jgi:hypothetical protein
MNLKLPLKLKLQKQKNLGKFLIFDVFVQLWIFTFTTNIRNVNFNLSYAIMHIIGKHFWAPQDHRWPQSLKLSFINFVIFRQILQKTLNFNCDFLKEGKRYLTFPVDFLKAQTIVFLNSCNPFFPISLLLAENRLKTMKVAETSVKTFCIFWWRHHDVNMGVSQLLTSWIN